MGFLEFITGFFKRTPNQKAIDKQSAKAKEVYAQPEYRKMAMEQLLDWNTKESLKAVLGRFSVVVQSPHWDEEEKNWLVDQLATRGDLAREVLSEQIIISSEVTHLCLALTRLCSKKELAQILYQALRHRKPENYRFTQAKMELTAQIAELKEEGWIEHIIPYLQDHNDDVACRVMDDLSVPEVQPSVVQEAILGILEDSSRSARVLRRAALFVHEKSVPLTSTQAQRLPAEVLEDYQYKNNHLEKRSLGK